MPDLREQLARLLGSDATAAVATTRAAVEQRLQARGNSVVLFGAGRLGNRVVSAFRNAGVEPIAFLDNNRALWNRSVNGVTVLPPEEGVKRYAQTAVFIVSTVGAVKAQLEGYGVEPMSVACLSAALPGLLPHCCLDVPQAILDNAARVIEGLSVWEDEASRVEYASQLSWRLFPNQCALPTHLNPADIYFPSDLVELRPDELFVDCGAFDGDTLKDFLGRCAGHFQEYLAFEPDPANIRRLKQYAAGLPDGLRNMISVQEAAVAARNGKARFDASGGPGSAIGTGATEVDCVTLDEALGARLPTYIKMDIEGSEYDALLGGSRAIERSKPVLCICLYHRPSDLWEIPLLIKSLGSSYKLFLRRYSDYCWEQVCYAVPPNRAPQVSEPIERRS